MKAQRCFVNLLLHLSLLLPLSVPAHALTYEAMKSLIAQNKITTIAGLLPLLPEALRSKYVLMFNSRSLHSANYANPRVLLYGDDASLIITFNGSPDQNGYEALETAEFDKQAMEFRFYEILFPEGKRTQLTEGKRTQLTEGKVSYSSANPEKCLKCHGTPARAIWDTQPTWPGAYGERYRTPLSKAEQAGLKEFLTNQATHPRYSKLLNVAIFSDKETFYPSAKGQYDGTTRDAPNVELSRYLSNFNTSIILKKLSSAKDFAIYRYALLGSLARDCADIETYFPPQLKENAAEAFKSFTAKSQRANEEQERLKSFRAASSADKYRDTRKSAVFALNGFRFIAESGLGVSSDNWTSALEVATYDFNAPQPIDLEFESQLLNFMTDDLTLQKLAANRQINSADKYCSYLQSRSRSALNLAPSQSPQLSVAREPAALTLKAPALIKLCIACHDGQVGPHLPFDQPDQLKQQLGAGAYPRGTLFDEILFRLSPEAGPGRMPRGLNISEQEHLELERYFRELKKDAATLTGQTPHSLND